MEKYISFFNTDIGGDDILQPLTNVTVPDCLNKCNTTPSCVGFTRPNNIPDLSPGTCNLKSGFNFSNQGVDTNTWLPAIKYEKIPLTNVPSSEIMNMTNNVENCSLMCLSMPGCVGFTRPANSDDNDNSVSCSLKNSFNSMSSDSNNNLFVLPTSLYYPQNPTCDQCRAQGCEGDCSKCAPDCSKCAIDCDSCQKNCCSGGSGNVCPPCQSSSSDKKWIIFLSLFLLSTAVAIWLFFFRKNISINVPSVKSVSVPSVKSVPVPSVPVPSVKSVPNLPVTTVKHGFRFR